jgi:hypothetical protein
MGRWSFAEQRRFLGIVETSRSLKEIVERTGRTPTGIRKMAVKSGIVLPKAELSRVTIAES